MATKLTRAQFIIQIVIPIGRAWKLRAPEAMEFARKAYHEFIADNGTQFGQPEFAWDETAAHKIAEEYVLRFGETPTPSEEA